MPGGAIGRAAARWPSGGSARAAGAGGGLSELSADTFEYPGVLLAGGLAGCFDVRRDGASFPACDD